MILGGRKVKVELIKMEVVRDRLCREKTKEKKDPEYKKGYWDGVLDMYNESKKQAKRQ